jgi:hypothetical protein
MPRDPDAERWLALHKKEELNLRHYGAYNRHGRVFAIAHPDTTPVCHFPKRTFTDKAEIQAFVHELVFLTYSPKGTWFWILKDNNLLSDQDLSKGTLNGKPRTPELSRDYIIDLIEKGKLAVFPLNEYIPPQDRTHHLPRTKRPKGEETVPAGGPGDRVVPLGPETKPEPKPEESPGLLKTVSLIPHYAGEEIPNNPNNWMKGEGTVVYLSDTEKEKYRLTVRDGKLHDANGFLFDTTESNTWDGQSKAIYVMDEKGRIFASREQRLFEFHHSSLGQGKPVAGAGEIEVRAGVLQNINNRSGHYKPPKESLIQTTNELSRQGLSLNECMVEIIG